MYSNGVTTGFLVPSLHGNVGLSATCPVALHCNRSSKNAVGRQ